MASDFFAGNPDAEAVLYHQRIKGQTRALVRKLGGVENAAADAATNPGTVSQWQTNEYGATIPARAIALLEKAAGDPVVTRELARIAGYVLVPAAGGNNAQAVTLQAVSAISTASAGCIDSIVNMLEDGQVEPHELRELATKLRTAIAIMSRYQEAVDGALAAQRVRPVSTPAAAE